MAKSGDKVNQNLALLNAKINV